MPNLPFISISSKMGVVLVVKGELRQMAKLSICIPALMVMIQEWLGSASGWEALRFQRSPRTFLLEEANWVGLGIYLIRMLPGHLTLEGYSAQDGQETFVCVIPRGVFRPVNQKLQDFSTWTF